MTSVWDFMEPADLGLSRSDCFSECPGAKGALVLLRLADQVPFRRRLWNNVSVKDNDKCSTSIYQANCGQPGDWVGFLMR